MENKVDERGSWLNVKDIPLPQLKVLYPKKERDRRKSICDTCEKRNGVRCGECGCFIVALTKINPMKCPINKF